MKRHLATTLLDLTASAPVRNLERGEVLIAQGDRGGELYVLESGSLVVERDGVELATLDLPNSVVGEMSALLDRPNSATVRAGNPATVRRIENAVGALERDPLLALELARLACRRLDATSALLVELSRDHGHGTKERSLLGRIFSSLMATPETAR